MPKEHLKIILLLFVACLAGAGIFLFWQKSGTIAQAQAPPGLEMIEKRTENSKTYDLGNGKFASEGSIGSIHYQDDQGNRQEIDTTIENQSDDAEFNYQNKKNSFQTHFKDKPVGNFIRFKVNDAWVKFRLENNPDLGNVNNVEALIADNTVIYPNAYDGVDLKYTVSSTRLLEEYIIVAPATAAKINDLEQKFMFQGTTYEEQSDGSINFLDSKTGEILWQFPKPVMYELNDPTQRNYGLHYKIAQSGANYFISKVLDQKSKDWLSNPERVYPVVIDATATLSDPTEDGYIDNFGNRENAGGELDIMYAYEYDPPIAIKRAYVEWNISSIPDSATITNTIFKYHGSRHDYDCHIHEMVAYRPSTSTSSQVYTEAGEGTIYADPAGFPVVAANQQVDLGASADSDLQGQLASDWFAIGIQLDSETGADKGSRIYSEEYASANPKPTLYVEYTLPNTAPVASSVSIDSGAVSVTLTEATTKNVVCTAVVTDNDGYTDITSVEAKLYRTGVGAGAANDNSNHYTLSGDAQCVPSGGSGTTENYTCTFAVYFYADPTDAGSAYEADNWTCQVTPSDGVGPGTAATDTIEMNTLTALNVTTTINYGALALGANTGTTDYTTTVTNTGNRQIDIQLDGYGTTDGDSKAMTCIIGSTIIGNERYSLTAATDWSTKTQLTDTATTLTTFDLAKGASSTKNVYWGLGMPSSGVGGSCSGKVNFTAVSG